MTEHHSTEIGRFSNSGIFTSPLASGADRASRRSASVSGGRKETLGLVGESGCGNRAWPAPSYNFRRRHPVKCSWQAAICRDGCRLPPPSGPGSRWCFRTRSPPESGSPDRTHHAERSGSWA
jgi:hypothetical protein